MKFVLFVEGYTEKKVLSTFFKKWLDPRLTQPVGIKVVRSEGWTDYVRDIAKKVDLYLSATEGGDIIAAIGLIDLYGPTIYPQSITAAAQRYSWARDYFSKLVGNPRFRQHFAVHETEAWLLSDPSIFPFKLPANRGAPETIDFDEPPAKFLDKLYQTHLKQSYKKVVDGYNLFQKLSPETAVSKCPYLHALLLDMLHLANAAGL